MVNEDLHKRFNSIIMLTTLVAAVNNDGYPTLPQDLKSVKSEEDNDHRTRSMILNAIAALHTRNSEIVAVVAHRGHQSNSNQTTAVKTVFNAQEPQGDPSTEEPRVEYPATHEEDAALSVQNLIQPFLEVTVIANPEDEDTYFKNASSLDQCRLVKRGQSHFTVAKSGNWADLFPVASP